MARSLREQTRPIPPPAERAELFAARLPTSRSPRSHAGVSRTPKRHGLSMIAMMLPSESLNHAAFEVPNVAIPSFVFRPG